MNDPAVSLDSPASVPGPRAGVAPSGVDTVADDDRPLRPFLVLWTGQALSLLGSQAVAAPLPEIGAHVLFCGQDLSSGRILRRTRPVKRGLSTDLSPRRMTFETAGSPSKCLTLKGFFGVIAGFPQEAAARLDRFRCRKYCRK